IKGVFSKKTLRKIIDELTNPTQSDGIKAFSAGLGIFIGIIPAWGLQTVAAVFVGVAFRLNKVLVVIFSQVSFPPFFPLILYFSYRIGKYWVGPAGKSSINYKLAQYLCGSIMLAVLAGISVGLLTFLMLKLAKALKQYKLRAALKMDLRG
ncbi:MAG TPA: DUF2062 domain-containing protein, partial [Mucilaginibacter sp.]|nr:DUF2062 domain-containing protein [Mucilaginibacter sp.]